MILLFPIDDYERDILREMTDHELVTIAEKDELVLTYPSTDEFLETLDNQEIDPQAYWHKEVNQLHVVTYKAYGQKDEYRVLCYTENEARAVYKRIQCCNTHPEAMISHCYDGSDFTMNKKKSKKLHIITITQFLWPSNVFSVTFTYDTPLTGKRHYVVECDTNEEAQKIAHDANTVDGIKYVHTYPVKRPTGTNGVRMTAEDYWKMYGNK